MKTTRNRLIVSGILLLVAVLCLFPGPLMAFYPAVRYTLAGAAIAAALSQLLKAPTIFASVFLWPNFLLWTLACVGDPERIDGLDSRYMGSSGYLLCMTGLTLLLLWCIHRTRAEERQAFQAKG